MTDRIEALRALLAKVEAGEDFSPMARIIQAHCGSLDAAKALHEALLPGWDFDINSTTGACVYINDPDTAFVGCDDVSNLARAWLIAILKALIAQEEADD